MQNLKNLNRIYLRIPIVPTTTNRPRTTNWKEVLKLTSLPVQTPGEVAHLSDGSSSATGTSKPYQTCRHNPKKPKTEATTNNRRRSSESPKTVPNRRLNSTDVGRFGEMERECVRSPPDGRRRGERERERDANRKSKACGDDAAFAFQFSFSLFPLRRSTAAPVHNKRITKL